jgi:hypothetical protein
MLANILSLVSVRVAYNGLAHLPPIIARQLTLKTTFSAKWPPRTRAEGGQVEPVLGGVAVISTCFSEWDGFLQTPLFSALKFVGCWFLEERNPWLHHVFGNVETCLRKLRIPYRKPPHQFIF